jgi:hypothetical protein
VAFAALAAFVAYALSAPSAPGVADYAEAQTVPYILGIPHQTGFPLYVLTGWVFSHALPFGTVAWRLNLFAAAMTALGVGGIAQLALELGALAPAAALGALAAALSPPLWYAGTHADAHALLFAWMAWALALAVRYVRRGEQRALVAGGWCCGLGLATHPAMLFALLSLALAAVLRRGIGALALAGVAVPLLFYAYLPMRSAVVAAQGLDPTAAAPLYGRGTIAWDTNHPRTATGFLDEVLGRESHAGPKLLTIADPRALVGRWLAFVPYLHLALSPPMLALALVGTLALALRAPPAAAVVLLGPAAFVTFTFAYGTPGTDVLRYLVPVVGVVGALAAAAAFRLPGAARIVPLAVVALLAWSAATALHDTWAQALAARAAPESQRLIDAVARDVPDGALVVVPWYDATPLAYGAFIEHALGRRIVVLGWPHDVSPAEYDAWSAQKRVFVYVGQVGATDMFGLFAARRVTAYPSSLPGHQAFEIGPARDAPRRGPN